MALFELLLVVLTATVEALDSAEPKPMVGAKRPAVGATADVTMPRPGKPTPVTAEFAAEKVEGMLAVITGWGAATIRAAPLVATPSGGSAVNATPASRTICEALEVEVPVVKDRFLALDVRTLPLVVIAPAVFVVVPNVIFV